MSSIVVLFYVIVIGGAASVLITLIALLISNPSHHQSTYTPPPEVKVDVHVDAPSTPVPPYPGIAEQFDGRLTNVVRNPLEGIL